MSAHKNRHVFSAFLCHNSHFSYANNMKFTSKLQKFMESLQNENILFTTGDIIKYLTRYNLCGHGWFSQTWSQILELVYFMDLVYKILNK